MALFHNLTSEMEMFAMVTTRTTGIRMTFGSNFSVYWDDKAKVWIISIIRILDSAPVWVRFRVEMGVMHEAGHILTNDYATFASYTNVTKKTIFNVVRDVTIEGKTMEVRYPGLIEKWYRLRSESIGKENNVAIASGQASPFQALMWATYVRARETQHGRSWGEGIILPDPIEEIYLRRIQPLNADIASHETIKESQELVELIFNEIMKEPPPPKQPQMPQPQSGQPQTGDDGDEGDDDEEAGAPPDATPEHWKDEEENAPPDEDDGEGEGNGGGTDNEEEESDEENDSEGSSGGGEDESEDDDDTSGGDEEKEGTEDEPEDKDDSKGSEDDSDGGEDKSDTGTGKNEEPEEDDTGEDDKDGDDGDSGNDDKDSNDDSKTKTKGTEDEEEKEEEEEPLTDDAEDELKKLQKAMKEEEEAKSVGEDDADEINKYADDTCLYRVATGLEERVIQPYPKYGWADEVSLLETKGREMTGYAGTKMKALFISHQAPVWYKNQRNGKLDHSKLWKAKSGSFEIMKRKEASTFENSAVSLIADNSISMLIDSGKKIIIAHSLLCSLGFDLDRMRIPFEAMGFTIEFVDDADVDANNGVRNTPSNIYLMKSFEEPYRTVRHRFALPSQHSCKGTAEFPALVFAAKRLVQRRETKKVLFLMTDGWTESGCDALNDAMVVAMKDFIVMLKRCGIKLVLIGMLSDAVKEYDPDAIVFNDLVTFADQFYSNLMKILL